MSEQLVTVVGIERWAINYPPNGIQCDYCESIFNHPRTNSIRDIANAQGWTYEDGQDKCPECSVSSERTEMK